MSWLCERHQRRAPDGGFCVDCINERDDFKEAEEMTPPTTPASPTSAEAIANFCKAGIDDFCTNCGAKPGQVCQVATKRVPPRFKMVDMSPAQAATFLKNIAVLANSGDKWDAFEEICKSMIESAFNAGALRPPSPPADNGTVPHCRICATKLENVMRHGCKWTATMRGGEDCPICVSASDEDDQLPTAGELDG